MIGAAFYFIDSSRETDFVVFCKIAISLRILLANVFDIFHVSGNLTKKSVLQEGVETNKQWNEGDPSRYIVEEGPNPYKDVEPSGSYVENFNANNRAQYESSLDNEENQRFETIQNPADIFGPKEHYFTVQKGNRKYETVITQSFRKKKVPERRVNEQADPALGSEYVSYPQDGLKDNEMEQYWDYVPVDNSLEFSRDSHRHLPALGEQRSVKHKETDAKGFRATSKNKYHGKTAPKAFTDRHSVSEDTHSGKGHGKVSWKHNVDKPRKIKEEENGRKRQPSKISVRNRSPEPSGKERICFQI